MGLVAVFLAFCVLISEPAPPAWLLWNVRRWEPLVERWRPDFPDVPTEIVLAIIAQESQGFPYLGPDEHGSVGLMQVTSRSWTATVEELKQPALNIYLGMWILNSALQQSDGDMRRALAGYNCGFEGLDAGHCGSSGGWAYADRVLNYWLPHFVPAACVPPNKPFMIGKHLAL